MNRLLEMVLQTDLLCAAFYTHELSMKTQWEASKTNTCPFQLRSHRIDKEFNGTWE